MEILMPPEEASQAERDLFYKGLKRKGRKALGRCPYCGRLPEPGRVMCGRCLVFQRERGARRRARVRAKRDAERRAALPRQCPGCGGTNLARHQVLNGRQRYRCRDCRRCSFGDGPPSPRPVYPCPYCGGPCWKNGRDSRVRRKPQVYFCAACGRSNTNLWPKDVSSPGGPFPHRLNVCLNVSAQDALLVYCQEKQMSVPQAIRDIFIRAAAVPPLRSVAIRNGGVSKSPMLRAYLAPRAPALPTIPPGGVRLPSARPAAFEKQKPFRSGRLFGSSVLVTLTVSVRLNDLALSSLLEMMRRRGLNHQDAARALIAETLRGPVPEWVRPRPAYPENETYMSQDIREAKEGGGRG